MVWNETKKIIAVTIGALLNAIAMNFFLIPANVFASGFTGTAQLISAALDMFGDIQISTGILLLLLNIPIAILAWFKVGKSFTFYSFCAVVLMSFFLGVLPVQSYSNDIMLNAVFGGVIGAAGVGLTLRYGASTGGMDIVAMILSKINDKPIGVYFLILNGIIIAFAGLMFNEEQALYTLISLYVTTRVIDAIHTRHIKVTAMIVTTHANELKQAIHSKLVRGITVMPAMGAFTGEEKHVLMIVISRYELYDLQSVIQEVDPQAFTNIVQSTAVIGSFRKD